MFAAIIGIWAPASAGSELTEQIAHICGVLFEQDDGRWPHAGVYGPSHGPFDLRYEAIERGSILLANEKLHDSLTGGSDTDLDDWPRTCGLFAWLSFS